MHIRNTLIAVVAAATLAPTIAAASPSRPSLQACVGAFIARLGTSTPASPKYRLARALERDFDGRADSAAAEFTFTLEARDPHAGVVLARATCTATSDGSVESLTVTPVARIPARAPSLVMTRRD